MTKTHDIHMDADPHAHKKPELPRNAYLACSTREVLYGAGVWAALQSDTAIPCTSVAENDRLYLAQERRPHTISATHMGHTLKRTRYTNGMHSSITGCGHGPPSPPPPPPTHTMPNEPNERASLPTPSSVITPLRPRSTMPRQQHTQRGANSDPTHTRNSSTAVAACVMEYARDPSVPTVTGLELVTVVRELKAPEADRRPST
jgi:hypothetical protein